MYATPPHQKLDGALWTITVHFYENVADRESQVGHPGLVRFALNGPQRPQRTGTSVGLSDQGRPAIIGLFTELRGCGNEGLFGARAGGRQRGFLGLALAGGNRGSENPD